jgi:hypothetical protein
MPREVFTSLKTNYFEIKVGMHVKDQKWFWFEDGSYVNE